MQREVKTTMTRRRRRTRDKVSLFATSFTMFAPKTKKAKHSEGVGLVAIRGRRRRRRRRGGGGGGRLRFIQSSYE
jgi:hypothetical protein